MTITMLHDVDLSTLEVCVYKNLTNGRWSIAAVKGRDNRGQLLAYADELVVSGARCIVKESRRQVIAQGGHREVCAWFVGKVADEQAWNAAAPFARVTFRPRERAGFFRVDDESDVVGADTVYFGTRGDAWLA